VLNNLASLSWHALAASIGLAGEGKDVANTSSDTKQTASVANAFLRSARDIRGPSPLVAIENEAPARLIVDPPLPEQLAQGRVFIQYRTENLRVLPVFGKGALEVSPRVGHVHITVDDGPWHFVDASGETVIVVGLAPGSHQVLFELADPTHRVIGSEIVRFTIPEIPVFT
jgi:Family of unknown function (DUF6130)